MNDKISEELLSAYLDGELSQSERADVAQLLESSPAAQQQLADFQKLSQWMQELPSARPPQGFAKEVLLQAERRSLLREPTPAAPVTATRRAWLKPTLGIAAAAAAVVFLVRVVPAPQPPAQQPAAEAIVMDDMTFHKMQAETAPAEELATEAQSDLHPVSRSAAPVALPAINNGQTADADKFNVTDEADNLLRQSKKPTIKKDKLVKLPAGQKWNRSRIGEVIHLTELDESQEQVAVFKAVVVNIDQWIGGTQVEVIGLEGASDTIAIHLEASPEELADFVAKINDDGGQLLDLEAGQPILVAQLSKKEQAYFGGVGGEQSDDLNNDALSVPPPFRSRTSPQSHIPKDVPPPVLGGKKRSNTTKEETAKEGRGDGEQKPAAPKTELRRSESRAIARQTTRFQVTAVPEALQSQIPAGTVDLEKKPSKPAVPSPAEKPADKPAKKLAENEAIFGENAEIKKRNAVAPRRVRMILLVRQQAPAAKKVPTPPVEKAGDGGGAA